MLCAVEFARPEAIVSVEVLLACCEGGIMIESQNFARGLRLGCSVSNVLTSSDGVK